MNGYRAMVERRRRQLAEPASRGERIAVPNFDWLVATIDACADAAHTPKSCSCEDQQLAREQSRQ